MTSQVSESARIMATGPHPDWRTRAVFAEDFGYALTEVISVGGHALASFLDRGWLVHSQATFRSLGDLLERAALAERALPTRDSAGQRARRSAPDETPQMDDETRRLLQEMAVERGRDRHHRLTIGELFPDGDVVGQWVFSVTALSDDLMHLLPLVTDALRRGDIRSMLFHHRQLVTRIYEARRLVMAAVNVDEIADFARGLLALRGMVDLRAMYVGEQPGDQSTVEYLYKDMRHRTVHYMWVGGDELRHALWNHSGSPAEVELTESGGRSRVWFQWVSVIQSADLLGDIGRSDALELMTRRIEAATPIATTWLFIAPLALATHMQRLGIDFEHLRQVRDQPTG